MQPICGHALLFSVFQNTQTFQYYWYLKMKYYNTRRHRYNCPIIHLWNAEKQSSWPTQGCFPRLDCQPPPPTTSRWEDFGYSQTSATTSRWLLADSHLVGSGLLSQWYPEFLVVAGTCLEYTSTLLQLQLLLPGCHVNLVHLWRFGDKNTKIQVSHS